MRASVVLRLTPQMLPEAEIPRRRNAYDIPTTGKKNHRGSQLTIITRITNEITILLGETE
jgi:hypothetical protein